MGDQPRDHTTERPTGQKTAREDKFGGYYYDDTTGYETYKPSVDDEENENAGREESTDTES